MIRRPMPRPYRGPKARRSRQVCPLCSSMISMRRLYAGRDGRSLDHLSRSCDAPPCCAYIRYHASQAQSDRLELRPRPFVRSHASELFLNDHYQLSNSIARQDLFTVNFGLFMMAQHLIGHGLTVSLQANMNLRRMSRTSLTVCRHEMLTPLQAMTSNCRALILPRFDGILMPSGDCWKG